MSDDNETPEGGEVQPIRKSNTMLANKLRAIADELERGRVRAIWLVTVDDHHRPELTAMCEGFSAAGLVGVIEVELWEMKRDVAEQTRR